MIGRKYWPDSLGEPEVEYALAIFKPSQELAHEIWMVEIDINPSLPMDD